MSSSMLRRSIGSVVVLVLTLTALSLLYQWLIPTHTAAAKATSIIVNPGESIQSAIDAAAIGDTIVINPGTYTENLTLNKAVSLTGITSATTNIRPAMAGSILTINDPTISNSVVVSGLIFTGGSAWGSGGGLYISNGAQPLIQNTVISGNSVGSEFSYGGGIYSNSPLTLIGVQFINNSAPQGGGLFLGDNFSSITAIISDCRFSGNLGGGIASSTSPGVVNVIVTNSEFLNNSYGRGIAINGNATVTSSRFEDNSGGGLQASSVIVSGTQFIGNSAAVTGGGAWGVSVVAINSLFERNTAGSDGGGMGAQFALTLTDTAVISNSALWYGCGAYQGSEYGFVSISNGLFKGNHCLIGEQWTNQGVGGGLYSSGPLTLVNTDFISNSAQTSGGAHAYRSAIVTGGRVERNASLNPYSGTGGGMAVAGTLNMTGVQFVSNTAPIRGGGLDLASSGRIVNSLFADNETNGKGAGIFLNAGEGASLVHVTIANTNLNPKQGIYIFGGPVGITDSIVSNYAIGIERESGYYARTVFEDYNLFSGNTKNLTGTITSGSHHPIGAPKFVNPAAGNYHLQPGSAAIDVGANVGVSTDIDGEVRPYGSAPDLGADEYWPSTLPVVITDLRITDAVTDSTLLTATLRWTAPINAVTYTLRYSSSVIGAGNWNNALDVAVPFTAAIPGTPESVDVAMPYSGGITYLAIRSQNAAGVYSDLSNNAFWPYHNVYLPLTRK